MKKILTGVALAAIAGSAVAAPPQCPLMRAPVCAVTPDGARAKYVNSCVAGKKHAAILHEGECAAPGKDPMMCNMLFKPVCATGPTMGTEKTFPNLCHAELAKAKLLHDGQCAGKLDPG
jgi:hypothetical protein